MRSLNATNNESFSAPRVKPTQIDGDTHIVTYRRLLHETAAACLQTVKVLSQPVTDGEGSSERERLMLIMLIKYQSSSRTGHSVT